MQEYYNILISHLSHLHTKREAENITKIYIEDRFDVKYDEKCEITESMNQIFNSDLKRLIAGEPVQYVVGKAFFYNSFFKVNHSVLIPRPETETLVYESITFCKNIKRPRILEIGSGSGCIALSIAQELENAKITSFDISSKAIEVANKNKKALNLKNVKFKKIDFLDKSQWTEFGNFDLIVSNPPYIKNSEKELMSDSTLRYEPQLALFPEHPDYLVFYKYIFELAKTNLNQGGIIACELNEFSVNDIQHELLLYNYNWKIINDLQDKPRVLIAKF